MKGVVFTEFIEFIEEKFGFDVADEMIENSKLSTNGIFTQAGNYPFEDIFSMILSLSKITKTETSILIQAYGEHLFYKLVVIYSKPLSTYNNAFDFIQNVEDVVHPEVKKLYPDSDLPTFINIKRDEKKLELTYVSNKPLMDLAKGLMISCCNYYEEKVNITYKLHENSKYKASFILEKE